jgi:hypothetical protein
MGTSASSPGPGKGVPLIPPGVPPINPFPDSTPNTPTEETTQQNTQQTTQQTNNPSQPFSSELAPARRFAATRTSLGRYAHSGRNKDLAGGLGHYTRSGLKGAQRAAQRMGGAVKAAGALYNVLDNLRANRPGETTAEKSQLAGRPAHEICDYIINTVSPLTGSQDNETARDAIAQAMADLMEQFPQIDLTAVSSEQIDLVIERYVAYEICHRIELDVGKAILTKSPDPTTAIRHLEEMKQYVRQQVAACFRARAEKGQRLTRNEAERVTATVIQDTFRIFEEYIQ